MKDLIELYCRRRGIPEPYSNTEIRKVLTRMQQIGMASHDEVVQFIEKEKL